MTYCQLTERERYQIEFLLARGKRPASIARELGRHRSTITREIKRNIVDTRFPYDAAPAHSLASERRKEVCEVRYKVQGDLQSYFEEKLELNWSPEQIVGRLALERGAKVVSKSSIYRFIDKDRNELLGKKYYRNLRHFILKRNRRPFRYDCTNPGARRSIRERPVACERREEIGHLERDLMGGVRGSKAVLVIADRKARRVRLRLVNRNSNDVHRATIKTMRSEKMKPLSITNDNGYEFKPKNLPIAEAQIGAKLYYCDPSSPWQRGTVENCIGLLRQYFPKKTNLSHITPQKLKRIEKLLNDRPRKVLNFKTPSEIYFEQLKKTGS